MVGDHGPDMEAIVARWRSIQQQLKLESTSSFFGDSKKMASKDEISE